MDNKIDQSPNNISIQQQNAVDEVGLLDLLLVVAKHNRKIIGITAVSLCMSLGYVLTVKNVFTAKTVIMPPQQGGSSASMLLGQLGGLAGAAGGALGVKNPGDTYVGMLKSRTVADSLITRFKLQDYYEAKIAEVARRELANSSVIVAGKDGFISIDVTDKDPKLAADLANAYVEELDKFNKKFAITEAAKRRLFFEKQLEQVKDDLVAAENALKQGQERTGVILPEKQGEAAISAAVALRAQVATKEVELNAMRAYATEQNPEYVRLREVVSGLRGQLAKIQSNESLGEHSALLSTGKMPEAGLNHLRRLREVKYQEALFEMMSKQFELAKIDEAKDAALIQVVDKAMPPEVKSGPKRALIVVLATLGGMFLGVLWAFIKEASERSQQNPESSQRVGLFWRYLRRGQ